MKVMLKARREVELKVGQIIKILVKQDNRGAVLKAVRAVRARPVWVKCRRNVNNVSIDGLLPVLVFFNF